MTTTRSSRSTRRQGRPTGPKPGFSRQDVVDAALEIGIADFTLTAVAGRLGVAVSGLYRAIASREDLLRACLSELATRMLFSPDPVDWRRNARHQVESLWALLEGCPGLDRLLITMPWAAECFASTIDAAHRAFVQGGLSQEDAALAVDIIADTTVATHVQVAALRADWLGGKGPSGDGFKHLPPYRPDPSWLERGWLDRKIDLILDGFQPRAGTARPSA
ncbi:DNA-binding transcriptional regulator, AcrR family [Actinomyces denticolens]|uniref:DNA-binding transcriptional regulator, AcrR family n=1 Tax=Actinomyces denticolens TaxID=52767 RepID=A0ABY1I1N4_9ACTO|nr:TetR/AcrR family transcriptional regulator [Actinomyces denticolens]SHI45603.1 DNA-binding transcriptional regulator, AcrR family [Actinomyces denticolens]